MKSNKQRRMEIKAKRLMRAKKLAVIDTTIEVKEFPNGAILADPEELKHNNTYGILPQYYVDKAFTCRDCGTEEIWTAKQQKWWYEVVKGHFCSTAVRCSRCRIRIRTEKMKQKQHMEEMAKRNPHPNTAFFSKVKKRNTS